MSKKRRGSATGPRRTRVVEPERRRLPIGRILVVSAAAVGAVALLVVIFFGSASATSYTCTSTPDVSGEARPITIEPGSVRHVATGTKIRYPSCPPTSGDHYAAQGAGPIRQGFYGPSSAAQPGGWVHNLEHGYAVALYRGEPDAATLAALREFARAGPVTPGAAACGIPSKVVVARFDDMSTPYAVLAWGRLLPMASWDDAMARAFAEQAIDATAPEPGAC